MYDATWLFRGAQSALFFYLSCAPCHAVSTRRRRKKQNRQDRLERDAYELADPGLYRHPSPYQTNEYWKEEINIGPGPPPKRLPKKERTARSKALQLNQLPSPDTSTISSDADVSKLDAVKQKIHQAGERWNRTRYQREDEELWGLGLKNAREREVRQGSTGGSSVGVPRLSSFTTAQTSVESFYTARAPPLNELHPPVVSNPSTTKDNNKWMLQPPPSARVMGGYERANRSRSGSGASNRMAGDVPLSRQVGERMIEQKLKTGEHMPSTGSQRRAKQRTVDEHMYDRAETPQLRSGKGSARRGTHSSTDGNEIADIIQTREGSFANEGRRNWVGTQLDQTKTMTAILRAPVVPPTASTNSALSSPPPKTHDATPPPLRNKDPSLHVLQDLVSPHALINSYIIPPRPPIEARIRLPSSGSQDDLNLRGPDVDSFFPPQGLRRNESLDVEEWAGRDIRMRWSVS